MRIALIDPSPLSPTYSSVANEPLGLCYLAAVAKKAGHEVKIFQRLDLPNKFFLNNIVKFRPDICALSVLTSTLKNSLFLSQKLKNDLKCKIIFGGPHPSGDPEVVKNRCVDLAILGEGEQTFVELLKTIQDKKTSFKNIKGLAYLASRKVVVTEPRPRIQNIDGLPLPYRDGLPWRKYKRLVSTIPLQQQRFATMVTTRGCPFNCSFCVSPLIWKQALICRSAKKVVEEIEYLIETYRINYIRFLDNDFMVDEKHALAVCEEIIKKKIKISWACFGSLRHVSDPLLKKMKQAGCLEVFYGIESLSQNNLNDVDKKLAIKNINIGLLKTEKAGLASMGSILLGYPNDTEKSMKSAEETLKTMPLDILQLAFVIPYPGTVMRQRLNNQDLITEDTDFYHSQTPVLKSKLSPQRLLYWRKRLYHSFFYSPNYQQRMKRRIRQYPEFKILYKNIMTLVTDYLQIKK
ncbi:MAG: radical SAM protein [Patescibacteria group bacterium]